MEASVFLHTLYTSIFQASQSTSTNICQFLHTYFHTLQLRQCGNYVLCYYKIYCVNRYIHSTPLNKNFMGCSPEVVFLQLIKLIYPYIQMVYFGEGFQSSICMELCIQWYVPTQYYTNQKQNCLIYIQLQTKDIK